MSGDHDSASPDQRDRGEAGAMAIMVTGAAGFIGGHVCERLIAGGNSVLALDDLSTGRLENLAGVEGQPGFEFREGDIVDPAFLGGAAAGFQPNVIIHLAGLVNVALAEEDPEKNFRLNLESTQRVAEVARREGAKRVVFASSAAVYGEPESLPLDEGARVSPIGQYGQAKLLSEGLLAGYSVSYGLETVSLRFFNVYGPRQDPKSPYSGVVSIFLDKLCSGEVATVFGDGKQSRDFVSVHDVARAVVAAATRPEVESGAYNVCTGEPSDLLELHAALAAPLGDVPEPAFAESRAGDIRHSLGAPQRAAEGLDFHTEVTLKDGLRELVELVEKPPPD